MTRFKRTLLQAFISSAISICVLLFFTPFGLQTLTELYNSGAMEDFKHNILFLCLLFLPLNGFVYAGVRNIFTVIIFLYRMICGNSNEKKNKNNTETELNEKTKIEFC